MLQPMPALLHIIEHDLRFFHRLLGLVTLQEEKTDACRQDHHWKVALSGYVRTAYPTEISPTVS